MSVPAPFTKCPNYYKPSVARFVVCTNVSDFCTYIADLHQIDLVLHWAIFIVPCVMCLLAFFMNMYNFYILIPMFKKLDDLTKKRYVFLISRALSSTMSIIAIFMMPVAILFTDYNFWFMAVFMIFDMISFLSFLGGIVGTTLTFYVVIVHPVFYQRELSFRRCCQIVIVFWVCSAVVAIGCGTVQAAFMGTNAPFQCDYHTCEKPVLMIAIVIISVTFAFSLGIQSFVIFSLYRHEKKSKERGDFSSSSKKMRAVMKRLFSGFVIFLMMAVFEVTSAVILVQNVFSISDRSISLCEFLSASGSRLEFIIFCSVLTLLWATGLFLDPIFTMLFDPMFSEEFSTHKMKASMEVNEWVNIYISNVLFLISVILNVHMFCTEIYIYWNLDNETRKHYIFVISRCLSSILAVTSLLVLESSLYSKESYSFAFYTVVFTFYNLSMDSLLVSYILISLVTYLGVVHPLIYKEKVTLKVMYVTVALNFLFSLCLAIPFGLFQAAVNAPGPVSCDLNYCANIINWITYSIAGLTLSITVLLTGFVVISLHYHNYNAKKNGINLSGVVKRARMRLTWTFIALVLICFIELFPVLMVIGFERNGLSYCDNFYRADEFLVQVIISSLETFIGGLVFLCDPLINIFFDKHISEAVRKQDISTSYYILLWLGFYIPATICSIAILVDVYCFILTLCIYWDLRTETRKRYIFLLMRISSSFFIAICLVLFESTVFTSAPYKESYTFYAIMFVIYDFSIFSMLGSFIGVSLITYFGVLKPLVYREKFTLRTVWAIAVGIWILSVLVAIPIGLFQAAHSVDGPIKCDSPTCRLLIKWLVFTLTCVVLLSAISTLLFVTGSLYWHHYKSKEMGSVSFSPTDHGRNRMAWTTGLLIGFCLIELIPTGLLVGFERYGFLDSCDNFYRADSLIFPAIMSAFETFMGAIAFLFDPIINLFYDRHISKTFKSQMKSLGTVVCRWKVVTKPEECHTS